MSKLPSGTVTFVFTDIEGSTSLLKRLGDDRYASALATHRRLVRSAFAEHGGEEIDTQGDAFFYSFTRARAALAGAVAVQRAHAQEEWPDGASLRIRLGMHTGEPVVGEGGYTGLDVVRASRIAAAARGGQVLLSAATRGIVANNLPEGVELHSLGERWLKDIDQPESLAELIIPDVPVTAEPEVAAPSPPATSPSGVDPVAGVQGLITDAMPDWLKGATERFLPPGNRLIEQRVLAQLEQAFRERPVPQGRRQKRPKGESVPPAALPPAIADRPGSSVADEIARLHALRESGALTDAQYERAVERALGEGR
jgi:class 3 adenylate cyclase